MLTKGYTILEMLCVLFVLSILMTLSPPLKIKIKPYASVKVFEQHYKQQQLKALAVMKPIEFYHHHSSNSNTLRFNAHGNVNQAQTIEIDNQKMVIQLGAGRYVIK